MFVVSSCELDWQSGNFDNFDVYPGHVAIKHLTPARSWLSKRYVLLNLGRLFSELCMGCVSKDKVVAVVVGCIGHITGMKGF